MVKPFVVALLALFPALGWLSSPARQAGADNGVRLLAAARQALVVVTPGWEAVSGTLARYERGQAGWRKVGESIPIVVGRHGLAWDGNLVREREVEAPIKREGDGRAPAGIFALTRAFGYAPSMPGVARYLPLEDDTECVDDPQSDSYGQIVNRRTARKVDWSSSEQMRRAGEVYRLGVIVDYNMSRVRKGAGSCIFLHIWKAAGQGTAGCTAMAPADVEALVAWLEPMTAVLVQLPQHEYDRLRPIWLLP